MTTRRNFLSLVVAASLLGLSVPAAWADDSGGSGSDGGGSGDSGSGSGGGSDDGGSDDGGSGSGGSDDGGSDGGGSDHGGSDGNGSSGPSGSNSSGSDNDNDDSEQTQARKAVARGDAVALKQVLADVNKQYPGRVVSVSLEGKGSELRYRIRVIDNNNRLLNLVVNARSGQITGIK